MAQFGIGFHASHYPMMKFLYADDYVEVFESVTADVFLFNSVAEPEANSVGGLENQILGTKFNAKDYDQRHGWVVRGDLNDSSVAPDVQDALEIAIQFALDRK